MFITLRLRQSVLGAMSASASKANFFELLCNIVRAVFKHTRIGLPSSRRELHRATQHFGKKGRDFDPRGRKPTKNL